MADDVMRDALGALGLIAAVGLVALTGLLGDRVLTPGASPVLGSTSALTGFQLLASFAGRGRPLPGLSLVPGARLGLATLLALLGASQLHAHAAQGGAGAAAAPRLAAGLAITAAFSALAEVSGRVRGPSVAMTVFVVALLLSPGESVLPVLVGLPLVLAVVLAARRLGLGRPRLARLGITPWAPSELALVPGLIDGAVLFALSSLLTPGAFGEVAFATLILVDVAASAAVILVLVYLNRRLRASEAFHAARAAAPAGAAP